MNARFTRMMVLIACAVLAIPLVGLAQETVDADILAKIRDEGMNRSQVMELASWLTDVHGSRLTGTPALRAAQQWCLDTMRQWGLSNTVLEPWGEFGRGWSLRRATLQMLEPAFSPLIAWPLAWTGGTGGIVRGEAVLVNAKNEEELARFKGTLRGRIVLVGAEVAVKNGYKADAHRYSDDDLARLANPPKDQGVSPEIMAYLGQMGQGRFRARIMEFCAQEGAVVILTGSRGTEGTLWAAAGGSHKKGAPVATPQMAVYSGHFNRMVRILAKGVPVVLEVDIETAFHEDDTQGYNALADIPGTDPALKDEIVLVGGHIDAWHAATGATDNAAGVVVAMEAARIIKSLGVEPRRTIRVALWDGEEQGIYGSAGYVKKHYRVADGTFAPEYEKHSVYFNFDNGTGRIRGVHLEENEAARPVFEAVFAQFSDICSGTIAPGGTGGTDHISFEAIGLPAFQWIQDPIAYDTRTHHTNMDDYDHLEPEDLKQAATVTAAFVWHAANREERFPRRPPITFVSLPVEKLESLAGTYQLGPLGGAEVTVREGALYIEVGGFPAVQLNALSENEFLVVEVKAKVTFERDASGTGAKLNLNMPGGMNLTGARKQ